MPSRWIILAWANFALAVAAVLKFIPILVSCGMVLCLTPEQIAAGLGDERLWSLDLISDTPYLCVCGGWSLCGCADRPEAPG
ncbi:MAG: hypothetical protein CM15mP74_15980 [Halieaceae bacterium]|nr:MAG: hypothetical protein CM15mP74_15980 [Halieaceae bacterium]